MVLNLLYYISTKLFDDKKNDSDLGIRDVPDWAR